MLGNASRTPERKQLRKHDTGKPVITIFTPFKYAKKKSKMFLDTKEGLFHGELGKGIR